MIRKQACDILGVTIYSTEEEIKMAYKKKVKEYHPDSGNVINSDAYRNVVWAYNFLRDNPVEKYYANVSNQYYNSPGKVMGNGTGKVLGGFSNTSSSNFSYSKSREYEQFQQGYQRRKEERQEALAKRVKAEKERQEKYDKAMEAINAIRVAEAIKVLINNSEKNSFENENIEDK